jgi:hypothetical protein
MSAAGSHVSQVDSSLAACSTVTCSGQRNGSALATQNAYLKGEGEGLMLKKKGIRNGGKVVG